MGTAGEGWKLYGVYSYTNKMKKLYTISINCKNVTTWFNKHNHILVIRGQELWSVMKNKRYHSTWTLFCITWLTYICIYTHIHIHTHSFYIHFTYIYKCIHTHMYMYMYVCMHVRIHLYEYVQTCVCICAYILYAYVHTCACIMCIHA